MLPPRHSCLPRKRRCPAPMARSSPSPKRCPDPRSSAGRRSPCPGHPGRRRRRMPERRGHPGKVGRDFPRRASPGRVLRPRAWERECRSTTATATIEKRCRPGKRRFSQPPMAVCMSRTGLGPSGSRPWPARIELGATRGGHGKRPACRNPPASCSRNRRPRRHPLARRTRGLSNGTPLRWWGASPATSAPGDRLPPTGRFRGERRRSFPGKPSRRCNVSLDFGTERIALQGN